MGLNIHALRAIAPYLTTGAKVLSLGYPDILVTPEQCQEVLGVTPRKTTEHGAWHQVAHALPETADVFEQLGVKLRCIDIAVIRGGEEVVDLNYPHELGEHDLVLDAGTTEHCFNVGQALLNAAGAVRHGGVILHTAPLSMMNHGFYNYCPTLLGDFYSQNGWVILTLEARDQRGTGIKYNVPPAKRFTAPPECALYCLARREATGPLKYPMQTKYLLNPTLKK